MNARQQDRVNAILWAQALLKKDFFVLDTETTGANPKRDQPVCVGIINGKGEVVLDALVKPTIAISSGASRVHGIYPQHVLNAPPFAEIAQVVLEMFRAAPVVIYNASFDVGILNTALRSANMKERVKVKQTQDAMQQYAAFNGAWNAQYGSYRWVKLIDACDQMNIPEIDDKAHSAIGDVKRTLALMHAMAASQ